jgi:hypothetical protein
MPYKTEAGPSWFALPCQFSQDAELMLVSVPAQMLFLRILGLCSGLQTQGRINAAQVQTLCSGMSRPKQYLDELVSKALLTPDSTGAVLVQEYVVSNAAHWLRLDNRRPSLPPGQNKNAAPKKADSGPRAPVHVGAPVKKEREIEREEGRTPSGSVRPSSAQAAPRGSGGAAQPAPNPEVPEVPAEGTMTGAEARASIRATLDRAKKTVPGSTGKDTKFSKYDPDRPITPIRSAMASGWDAE